MQMNGQDADLPTPRGPAARIATALHHAKGTVLWGAFICALAAFVASGGLLFVDWRTNTAIKALRAGKDIPVTARARPALLEARTAFLLERDRMADAQPLLDQILLRADTGTQVRALYNMANTRLRAAIAQIEQGKFDKAIPLVTLAKAEYRGALRRQPEDWNAKHNLDVAMRLVRDLPRGEGEEGEEPEQIPSKLWTDLPGVPKGLP